MATPILPTLPPQAVEAEADALATVLIAALGATTGDASTGEAERCLDEFDVAPTDLYSARHRRVLATLRAMQASGEALIPQTLKIRLVALGSDATEDQACVDGLLLRGGSPAHQKTYAGIVREQARKRRLLNLGVRLQEEAQNGTSAEDIVAGLRAELDRQPQGAGAHANVRARSVSDLMATAEPRLPWLIEGLLCARFVMALVSEAKAGKSSLISTYVRALLAGQPFWGRPVRTVSTVLWVTEEDPSSIALMCAEYGLRGLEGLHFLTRAELAGLSYADQQAVIARERERLGAEVVILDTLSAHARFQDENDNAEMERAIAPWKRLAVDTGCAVIVTHHANKAEGREGWAQVRGGSAFAGAVDAGFILKRRPGSVRRLEFLGGRGSDWVEKLEYERHEDVAEFGARWRLAEIRQPSEEEKRKSKEQAAKQEDADAEAAVLEHVGAIPGVTKSRLEREVDGGTRRVRATVNRLERRGELRREVRGQSFCYFLASQPPEPGPTPPSAPPIGVGRGGRGRGGGPKSTARTALTPPNPAPGAVGAVPPAENALTDREGTPPHPESHVEAGLSLDGRGT